MIQKYGNIDADDIRMKMDAIKQEPRERVQKYFERLDKLFRKDSGCVAKEEIPGQTQARNPEVMCCKGVCRHRGVGGCCN